MIGTQQTNLSTEVLSESASETAFETQSTENPESTEDAGKTETPEPSVSETETKESSVSETESIPETVTEPKPREYEEVLKRTDWNPRVKKALNDFFYYYGEGAPGYPFESRAAHPYAVFDFDNTISVFDVEEQLIIYQLQHMNFAMQPSDFPETLKTGLNPITKDLQGFGYGKGTYADWISDLTELYTELWNTYGPFTPEGVSDGTSETMQNTATWKAFATKMRALYSIVFSA